MFVLGTAGHVDHGKSTLIQRLTGVHPDRLAEEQAREMSIELGFAWLSLPSFPEEIGIIDVPGHRDFIANMLAGIGGIDLALLLIAADEGIMPQTKEHIAILHLLQIPKTIIALSKIDMIDDPEWIELITLEIQEAIAHTHLADAPIIPLSAKTGAGIPLLKTTITQLLEKQTAKVDYGQPRLPLDRIFSLSGFGTIGTGTLVGGSLSVGDQVRIQPQNLPARIRSLQSHNQSQTTIQPGHRVAVNLTGVTPSELQRGDLLTHPGTIRATQLCDVHYQHLPDASIPITHNLKLNLFTGATQTAVRIRLLGTDQIEPGQSGWLQLVCTKQIAVARHDSFILRRLSPSDTLGGGKILDPHPGRKYKRFDKERLAYLKIATTGRPEELLLKQLQKTEPIKKTALQTNSGFNETEFNRYYSILLENKHLFQFNQSVVSTLFWQQKEQKILHILHTYHQNHPLRLGVKKEELRNQTKLSTSIFNPLLEQLLEKKRVAISNSLLHLPHHQIKFTPDQQAKVDQLLAKLTQAAVQTESVSQCKNTLTPELYQAILDLKLIYQLNNDILYPASTYHQLVDTTITFLQKNEKITVAQLRDLLQTSRKYALALLEHLDAIQRTKRESDWRILN